MRRNRNGQNINVFDQLREGRDGGRQTAGAGEGAAEIQPHRGAAGVDDQGLPQELDGLLRQLAERAVKTNAPSSDNTSAVAARFTGAAA